MSEERSSPQHLIGLADLGRDALHDVLDLAQRLKGRPNRGELAGRSAGMLFFRGSLRTRASFEAAINQLGGQAINLTAMSDFWDLEEREGTVMDGRAPEHVKDAAVVLSRYVDVLAIRPAPAGHSWDVDRQDREIQTWARHATVPVINMESAQRHPLQALADLMTMREHLGSLPGKRLAVTWVHSPEPASVGVVHSLLYASLLEGMTVHLAHPPGYEIDGEILKQVEEVATENGGSLETGHSLEDAVEGAQIVYARSWQSLEDYGNKTLSASHRARLRDWKIDEKLMELGDDMRLMHAMPIRRNVEVNDAILDGTQSLIYEQAENRLHSQKALLLKLLR
ncbi:MAG: N-acetylornithine carbamoyltransferase [Planctomycetota bacterium]|nr:N-acetylornithine carbamoyltransferase [Planctomycetota bacterium]